MTTQNELTRSKRHLKNTLRMKRLSTLQQYNFLRHKNEKISFDLFLKNFTRLNNKHLSVFETDVNDSSLFDSEKVELTKNHKPITVTKSEEKKMIADGYIETLTTNEFGRPSYPIVSFKRDVLRLVATYGLMSASSKLQSPPFMIESIYDFLVEEKRIGA